MRLTVLALFGVAVLAATPIPAPVVVDEPGGLPPGRSLEPAVTRVEVPPDGVLVTHHLTVGDGPRTVLELAVRAVEPAADGAPELGAATDAVRLPADTVTLDAGERATVTSLVHGPLEGPTLLAVEAAPRDGGDALAALVLAVPPGTPQRAAPGVDATLRDEVLRVTLAPTGAAHATADVRVRLTALAGPGVLDETLRDVLLWPDRERELAWHLDLPPWPVPYTLEVVAGEPGSEVSRTETTVWPPLRAWLPGVAVLLLVATVITWWWVRRRSARLRDGA